MGFKFTFKKNSKEIKKIIESISSILGEVHIEFSKEGFKIIAMDDSHICLIALTINKDDIEISDIEETEQIALNLVDLNKIISRRKDKEILSFVRGTDTLNIEFQMKDKEKIRVFKLIPIDLEVDPIDMESLTKIEYDTFFTMYTKDLDDIIKDAFIFTDYLNLKREKNAINFNCMGMLGDMENVWEAEEFIESTLGELNLNNTYGLAYLANIIKSNSFIPKFKIKTGFNLPMIFESDLFEKSNILYFLAPRTEDEDDEDEYEDEE